MLRIIPVLLFGFVLSLAGATVERIYGPGDLNAKNLGLRSVYFGDGLEGKLDSRPDGALWTTTGKSGWSVLGIQFRNPRAIPPIGFRIDCELPRELSLTFGIRVNDKPEKGFWSGRQIGRGSFSLPAGRQIIEKTWAELKAPAANWSAINAIVMVVNEAAVIRIFNYELIYPETDGHGESLRANWFDASQNQINPVARPNDKLRSVFALQAGGGRQSLLDLARHPATGDMSPVWSVTGDPAKGFASYGFGLSDPVYPTPVGLVFEFNLPEQATLTVQPMTGFNKNRTQGFYSAKKIGKAKTVNLGAGKQTLTLRYQEFDIPVEEINLVNSVRFSGLEPGKRIFFDRIDFLFADSATASNYRTNVALRLDSLHKVLIAGLVARGIDWKKALEKLDTAQTEPLIWVGMQLSAQREQIDYFSRLAVSVAPELQRLENRRAALVKRGSQGNFATLNTETDALQVDLDRVIDRVLAEVPVEKRRFRYDTGDRQFHYPDGRFFRMFAPHFFRSLYQPGYMEWRPWDLRYLAGLGFNGIRLHVSWDLLEPERGRFESGYLGIITRALEEAERYGFGISVDLHWPFPNWFIKGKPGFEVGKNAKKTNAYHWPDALVDTWERFGKVLARYPNIVAFEVPTNETNISGGSGGLTDTPYLMKLWNDFLKEEYGSREKLDATWRAAGDKYGLRPEENWEQSSIQPQGFQGDSSSAEAFLSNPRVYDHLRFCAKMQKQLSGDIVKALRQSIPDAYGMFQRLIGDVWDRSAVPLDYHSIITCIGENVLPGTHYGMGSISARKAATLSLGSYDSEQQMEGSRKAVERHVGLGLGFCPFTLHFRGGGGMMLADDDWHLKPEVAYLPRMADWIRNSVPKKNTGHKVAVITNSRLEATTGRVIDRLPDYLENKNYQVGIFDSLRIVDEPSLLTGYEFVITSSNFLDLKLLAILRHFPGKVFLFGRLDRDAYSRSQQAGLPKFLADSGLIIRKPKVASVGELADSLDLAGRWDIYFTPSKGVPETPPAKVENFEGMNVPGLWGETGITGSLRFRIGDGWYRRKIAIPAKWKGRPLRFQVGAIDDIDWVFWNGKLIGKTGVEVNNYWQVSRNYAIPPELVRYDRPNELYVCVRNLRDDGGIVKGPVVLVGQANGLIRFGKESVPASCSSGSTLLTAAELVPEAQPIAFFKSGDTAEEYVVMLRQDNLYWYFQEQEFQVNEKADRLALETFLDKK
jgi:hypothetical protein